MSEERKSLFTRNPGNGTSGEQNKTSTEQTQQPQVGQQEEKKVTLFIPKEGEFAEVKPKDHKPIVVEEKKENPVTKFEEGLPPPPESVLLKMDQRAIVKKGNEYVYVNKDGSFTRLKIKERAYVLVFPKNRKKKPLYKRVDYYYYTHVNSEEMIDTGISKENKAVGANYAWAVFNQKYWKEYDVDFSLLRERYIFEIVFNKRDWKQRKIKGVKGTMRTIEKYALWLLAYYGYESLESVTAVNFEKNFWESIFIPASKKTKMSTKELYMFTQKLGKKYRTNPEGGDKVHMREMIYELNAGAARNTAIQLLAYMEEYNLQLSSVIGKIPENFDAVYQSVIRIGQLNGKMADAFLQLAEITSRRYELSRAIVKSLRMPMIALVVVCIVGVIAVTVTVPIIEDIYTSFGAELPATTHFLKFLVNSGAKYWYIYGIVGLLFYSWYNYWSQYTLYGKRFVHDITLSVPGIGPFIKKRDYEVLTAVCSLIYQQGEDLGIILHKIKKTVSNFHIAGVLHTAALNWEDSKIYPGLTMEKYEQYIDPKIANAWKGANSPVTEFATLSNIYKGENDDFVENLQKTAEPLLMVLVILVLGFIIAAVVFPLYNVVNVIK